MARVNYVYHVFSKTLWAVEPIYKKLKGHRSRLWTEKVRSRGVHSGEDRVGPEEIEGVRDFGEDLLHGFIDLRRQGRQLRLVEGHQDS